MLGAGTRTGQDPFQAPFIVGPSCRKLFVGRFRVPWASRLRKIAAVVYIEDGGDPKPRPNVKFAVERQDKAPVPLLGTDSIHGPRRIGEDQTTLYSVDTGTICSGMRVPAPREKGLIHAKSRAIYFLSPSGAFPLIGAGAADVPAAGVVEVSGRISVKLAGAVPGVSGTSVRCTFCGR
jgi:hypothetical protein